MRRAAVNGAGMSPIMNVSMTAPDSEWFFWVLRLEAKRRVDMPPGIPSAYSGRTGPKPCASSRPSSSLSPVMMFPGGGRNNVYMIPILFTRDNPNKDYNRKKNRYSRPAVSYNPCATIREAPAWTILAYLAK
jgi:hypothetical protein